MARLSDEEIEAEEMTHHPDIEIPCSEVTFRISTHSERGLARQVGAVV